MGMHTPKTASARLADYRTQNGSLKITDRQRRRWAKKGARSGEIIKVGSAEAVPLSGPSEE